MTKFKVLDYFQWGKLIPDKNQIILVEELEDGLSVVSVEHYPEKNQKVSTLAVDNMVLLKKIMEY